MVDRRPWRRADGRGVELRGERGVRLAATLVLGLLWRQNPKSTNLPLKGLRNPPRQALSSRPEEPESPMCRWIAYRGETIKLERYVTAPAHSLVVQSMRALEGNASTNGDGFGLGWYDAHDPEPGLYREVRPAWSDENLRHLCRHIRSHLFFAHVRASTGTAITRANCHPFASGKWMFMHNGFLGDWQRLRREIESLIPDDLYASRAGTTDSEAVFLAMVGAGLETSPIDATARVLSTISALVTQGSRNERLRFTAALTDGQDLYAFRYAVNDSANSLYYRSVRGGVVIVSEPLDREPSNWAPVPENSVLVATAGRPATVQPLFQDRRAVA